MHNFDWAENTAVGIYSKWKGRYRKIVRIMTLKYREETRQLFNTLRIIISVIISVFIAIDKIHINSYNNKNIKKPNKNKE